MKKKKRLDSGQAFYFLRIARWATYELVKTLEGTKYFTSIDTDIRMLVDQIGYLDYIRDVLGVQLSEERDPRQPKNDSSDELPF